MPVQLKTCCLATHHLVWAAAPLPRSQVMPQEELRHGLTGVAAVVALKAGILAKVVADVVALQPSVVMSLSAPHVCWIK